MHHFSLRRLKDIVLIAIGCIFLTTISLAQQHIDFASEAPTLERTATSSSCHEKQIFTLDPKPVDPSFKIVINGKSYFRLNEGNIQVTFEVCLDNEHANLLAVGYHRPRSDWTYHAPATPVDMTAAIFDGDYSNFDYELADVEGSGKIIKIMSAGNPVYLSVIMGEYIDSGFEPTSILVAVGSLSFGAPETTSCQAHEISGHQEFVLESATFSAELCTFLGGGETLGYRFLSLTVKDQNPALATPIDVKLDGDQLAAAFKYKVNHHNACDSFLLTLPQATYTATSGPNAGCGSVVQGAISRTYDDNRRNTLYQITYGQTSTGIKELANKRHYFSDL